MKFKTIQDTPVEINFKELLNDRGWELSGNLAIHQPCNSNTKLKLISYNLQVGATYTVTFSIRAIDGTLGVGLDSPIQNHTTTGVKTITFTATNVNQKISFWGTGYIEMETVNILKQASAVQPKSEHTITWDEGINKWITFKSYRPELGFSMFNDLFTLKNGLMYVHKQATNSYNVFYGQSFDTYIEFPISSVGVKTYQSLAIHANRIVATSENGIKTQLGHVSDLLEVDFETKEGIYYANYLRDKMTGIVNGDRLKGRYIVLDLQAKGSQKLQIFKIVSKASVSTPNE